MSVCPNGTVEAPEECDDGNMTEGDRCSRMCMTEHPDGCPGTTIHLDPGQSVTINDTTTGAADDFQGSSSQSAGICIDNPNANGPDLIYAVTPSADGTITATLFAAYNKSFVRVRTACPGTTADERACYYTSGSNGTTMITFGVTGGSTYYVAADSYGGSFGGFSLTLGLQ